MKWVFWILGSLMAVSLAATPAKELTNQPSLKGVVFLAGSEERLAFMRNGESDPGSWLRVGGAVGGLRVAEIHRDRVALVSPSGERQEIRLNHAIIRDSTPETSPSEGVAPIAHSRELINSRANPMVFRAIPVPHEISERWAQLTAEDRAEVALWYQKHGWNLQVEASEGYFSAVFSNIYAEERKAIVAAKLDRFRASLTDKQREEYESLRQASVLSNAAGSNDAKVELAQRWQRFRNQLTAAQGSAIRTISDFTVRD
jgi:hypothetical protein